ASMEQFGGVGRRFDKVGELGTIPVFDDYAHHPTEISSVLGMVRDYFPDRKITAVFEPHQVSRLRLMFDEYASALMIADHIIVAKTHMGREIHKGVVPITEKEWCEVSEKFIYQEENEKIRDEVVKMVKEGECDIIVVIGAANSYKISRLLCDTKI
ncbi:MAG: UDP-N-acetylmuramate--L-alanine ligase, partial [Lachnospiraceae bacterium]|nr:UDP-N-acetylmuramate--L-alanine ligase [Lachnospiraceae bacterium]